jgi:hypothetical protein
MRLNSFGQKTTPLSTLLFSFLLTSTSPFSGAQAAEGTTFAIVDTNQTLCYGIEANFELRTCPGADDDLYGQDANYTINPPAYRDNGDGTISDLVTGLMWQKGFTRDVDWSAAPGLATRADTGGHSDWRVPSTKELYSLLDFSGHQGSGDPSSASVPHNAIPFIDTDTFDFEYPRANRYIDAQYITSTAYTGLAMGNKAFMGVNFADGRIKGYPQVPPGMERGWYVKFVRGNPDYGKNAFQDNGDGSITDRATGLAWTQADSGHQTFAGILEGNHYKDGRMDWPEALGFCENLNFASAKDWRLPSAKELQGLVDYSRSPMATNSAALDPVFHVSSITDEGDNPNFPGFWTSTTLLDGRQPGSDSVVVFFGEALGSPGRMGPPGAGGGRPPPPMHGEGRPPMHGGGPPPPMPNSGGKIMDVHGAGAQRSDPKTGDSDDYPIWGHGPQGDVRRVYNHVRCVRTAG